MKPDLAKKIKQAYQDKLWWQTLKEGRLVCFFTVMLYSVIILFDIKNNIPASIIFWRFIGLVPVSIFTLFAFSGVFRSNRKWLIPFYTISIGSGVLNMAIISILMYQYNLETSPVYHIFPAGFVFALILCANFAYGSRKYMQYIFPIIIGLTDFGFFYYGINQARFLTIINLVTVFAVIIMRKQEVYEYQATELLEFKESELIQTNQSLREANQKLVEMNRALSHDLKTPLRNIGSFAQLVSQRVKNGHYSEIPEYMAFITKGVRSMYKLLEDMLLFSSLSHKDTLLTEPLNLNELLTELKESYLQVPDKTKVIIDIEEGLPVLNGNSTKVFFLFQNLFDNGFKYNESEVPQIIVQASCTEEKSIILVKDNGIGFEEEYADKIFEMFQRLNTNKYEGSGIGLATCKEIVLSMNGKIWAQSTPGQGSTFVLEFPKE